MSLAGPDAAAKPNKSMQLPETLRTAIELLVEGQSTAALSQHYQAISDRYRREVDTVSLQITSMEEAVAYAAARLPATYGAVTHVCEQLQQALPEFSPVTLTDLGSGPGTATLAAFSTWPGTIAQADLIEPNSYLRAVSQTLIQDSERNISYQPSTLERCSLKASDLVLASYVLNEVSSLDLEREIVKLWNATQGALVLIEPGTPLGYDIILRAREILIKLNAHIAAPCPHQLACPLVGTSKWCHMSERIERSAIHRKIKGGATLGYEDEKFSYLVASRVQPTPIKARVLGHPHGQKLVDLELCEKEGTACTRRFSKRDPEYKVARKIKWGDAL